MKTTRQQRRQLKKQNAKRRLTLAQIPRDRWPIDDDKNRTRVWLNREFLIQEFDEQNSIRITVNRTEMMPNGRWLDGISWDELQQIKNEIGYGKSYAIEIYPPDHDIVNDANIRHLWVLPVPLPIGWTIDQSKSDR